MIFVALLRVREGTTPIEVNKFVYRRGEWGHPQGKYSSAVNLIDEYWLQTEDPKYIVIFETDEPRAIMDIVTRWEDHFEATVVPARRVEELLAE